MSVRWEGLWGNVIAMLWLNGRIHGCDAAIGELTAQYTSQFYCIVVQDTLYSRKWTPDLHTYTSVLDIPKPCAINMDLVPLCSYNNGYEAPHAQNDTVYAEMF